MLRVDVFVRKTRSGEQVAPRSAMTRSRGEILRHRLDQHVRLAERREVRRVADAAEDHLLLRGR